MSLKYNKREMEKYWHSLGEIFNALRNKDKEALSIVCHPDMPLFVNKYFDFFQKKAIKEVLAKLGDLNDKRFLDIGCGGGRWCYIFSQYSTKVTGIDISNAIIEKNKEIFPQIDFRVMSATKLEFPDEYFDIVSAITVIQHIPYENQIEAVKEMVRVTRKGGYIVILEYVKPTKAPHVFSRSEGEWISIIKNYGCELFLVRRIGYDLIFRALNKLLSLTKKGLGLRDRSCEFFSGNRSENYLSFTKFFRKILFSIAVIPSYPLEFIFLNFESKKLSTHSLFVFRKCKNCFS